MGSFLFINSIKLKNTMYIIYYNHQTNAHSIVNEEMSHHMLEDDVDVFKGSLAKCKAYLEPLNTIYQTIDTKCSLPCDDEGPE